MTYKYEVKPYYKTPIRKRKTAKLTAKEIISFSDKMTIKNAKKVAIVDAEIKRTPKLLEGWTTYKLDTRNMENGHNYRITIFCDTPIIKASTKLIIDSPNPKWVYTFEYVMASLGNAFIYRCNGDPPVLKNPGKRPGIDHHVYASIKYLAKNSKEIQYKIMMEEQRKKKAKAKAKLK